MKQRIKVKNKHFRRYLGVIFASLFFIFGPFSGTALADAGFTVAESSGSTSVSESGSTDTFTVVLDEQPSAEGVAFSVASGDTGEVTVSPATLEFTSSNWNTAQTVTVTGVNDDLIDGNQTTTITIAVVDAISDDD